MASLKAQLSPIFRRKELKATAGVFLAGLLSGVTRKTGWQMAEQTGLHRPDPMQSLLGRSLWAEEALRDAIRGYVFESLGDPDCGYRRSRPPIPI
ncbi:SRSO17 transposase [Rhodoblastus sphagnicola]|uniref:hypothetical protein n=1 Tax=Rhodoblastus sphagnicola TaxID=333368 RepID=UPI001304ED54|nr:hypothetical protein [Rhodoblastus sphagnicola]MBB4200394.1 SRSO17 transposase [Rhodoblastus sphagnicola]